MNGKEVGRRRALNLSVLEGLLAALMVGTAESFAIYFAVHRGMSVGETAAISMAPTFLGAIAQCLVPRVVRTHSLKAWILFCSFLQVLGCAGLFLSIHQERHVPWIFCSLTLYWIGAMVIAPLWLDWVSPWLKVSSFRCYIAKRSGWIAFVCLAAYLFSALLISRWNEVFGWIFGFAVVAKSISLVLQVFQPTPQSRVAPVQATASSPKSWLPSDAHRRPILMFFCGTVLFRFSVAMGSPFFLPYMVKDLKLGLWPYIWCTATPFLGRWLMLSRWGRAAREIHAFTGLEITMVGISITPLLWSLTRSALPIGCIEFFSGVWWGGFDLCLVLIVQSYLAGRARKFYGILLAASSLAALAGAALGAQLLENHWSFHQLLYLTAGARMFSAALLIGALYSVKQVRRPLHVYVNFLFEVMR